MNLACEKNNVFKWDLFSTFLHIPNKWFFKNNTYVYVILVLGLITNVDLKKIINNHTVTILRKLMTKQY